MIYKLNKYDNNNKVLTLNWDTMKASVIYSDTGYYNWLCLPKTDFEVYN